MCLSQLKEVIISYTTFGGELDFPSHVFVRGIAAIGVLGVFRFRVIGVQISHSLQAFIVLGAGLFLSLAFLLYFLHDAAQYTTKKKVRKTTGILVTSALYLGLGSIATLLLYPTLNSLRTAPIDYSVVEAGAGANILTIATLLAIIWNRRTLKSRYPSLQSIKDGFSEETDQALDRIQTTIGGIGHIDRPEIDRISDQLERGYNVPVTGEGGVGKSGVLAGVTEKWEDDVLFIDASRYSTIRNDAEISTALGFDDGVERPIKQLSVSNHVLIIVDQLDDIDREAGNIYRDFLLEVAELENIAVAFACRDHDLDARPEYEPLANAESFSNRETIGLLRPADVEEHIRKLIDDDPSDDLLQLGRKIENLDIISQLARDGVNFSGITGDVSLWDKFREQLGRENHPDDGTRSGDVIIERLTTYATEAIEDQSDGLNIFSVGTGQDWIDRRLINKGVIEVATDCPGHQKYRFRHLDFQRYLYAWNAFQENRTIQEVTSQLDERLGKDVFRFMLVLYMRSEGATADQIGDISVDSDTGDHAQQFLEEMLDEEEGLGDYTAKTILDEIRTWDISSNDGFAHLILDNLQDRETLFNYFFDSATDVSWAETLHERGEYTHPPDVLLGYLRDLAPYHPETVANLIRSIDTEDRHSLALVITVIRELPFDTAAGLIDVVTESITASPPDWHGFQATKLLQELIEAGETDAGLDLLNALLQPRRPTSEEPNNVQSVTRLHSLKSALADTLETLVRVEGDQAIDILEARLREAITTEAEIRDREPDAVGGPITTSIAVTNITNETTTDFKNFLIQTHRKAVDYWIDKNLEDDRAELLTRYLDDITVFRRLGLYILREHKEHYTDLVTEELLDETNYGEVMTKEDFLRLLRDGIDVLSDEDRRQVIDIITDIPVQESLEDAAADRNERSDEYSTGELANIAINRWRRDRLWLIRDWLPDERDDELRRLIDEYGEPDNVLSLGKTRGGLVSQESPLTEEEIWQLSAPELIDYCICEPFEATGWNERDGGGLVEVSPRGLAEAAIPRILQELDEFQHEIPRLRNASPIYVTELLRGLRDMIDDEPEATPPDLPWTPFLDLCETVAANPDQWSESARINVARLFRSAYSTSDLESVLDHNNRIKELLFTQLEDPHPTEEREHPPEGHVGYNNPAQTAINAVRPLALNALIRYSVRIANLRGYDGYSEEDDSAFDPDVREKIEGAIQDGSLSTLSTIGRSLNTIWSYDHDLILDNFEKLFPQNQTVQAKKRFTAVWDAYLAFNQPHETMFPHLRPCYHHGINLIVANENTATRNVERGLVRHLLITYLDGSENLTDPQSLLSYFYAKEEPDLARQAAWQLWRWGENNEDIRDKWPKVRTLWEWRLDQVDDPDAYAAEFQWFVEWRAIISDRAGFDEVVSLLINSAPYIARKRRAWETAESYLADHAEKHPTTAIDVYTELIAQDSRPNGISFSDMTAEILETGLDEDHDTRSAALDIAESYFTDGDDTAEQFLDEHT